jgi:hypothetical protein
MNRKHFDSFHIAGFTYYEGVLVFDKLKIGTELRLKPEPENRYDANAVAIYFKKRKIGFVPRTCNKPIAAILDAGHKIFELRVQQVKPDAHPENQMHVVLFVKTKNKTN